MENESNKDSKNKGVQYDSVGCCILTWFDAADSDAEYRRKVGIWIPASQAFPVITNSAIGKQMFSKWLETHFSRETWYKADYRVIGDVGLVWGVRTSVAIVKATGTGKRTFEKESLYQ